MVFNEGTNLHDQLSAYALGALDGVDAARFEDHLATCERCAAELESFASVTDALADVDAGSLTDVEDAPRLRRIIEQVRGERRNARQRRLRRICAAAALVLGIATLVVAPLGIASVVAAGALFGVAAALFAWPILASAPESPASSPAAALTRSHATLSRLERLRGRALAGAHPLLAAEIDTACQRVRDLVGIDLDIAALLAERPEPVGNWIADVDRVLTEVDIRALQRRTARARLAFLLNLPLGEEASINFAVSRTAEQFERMNREILSRINPLDGSHV